MSNHYMLTQRVDHSELAADLVAEGVTYAIGIDHEKVMLRGDAEGMAAQLALVATAEAAHVPTTLTEVTLQQAPHMGEFTNELNAAVGAMTGLGIELPDSYPGTACLFHNSLSAGDRTTLGTAATDHDPTTVPSLSVDVLSQVIAANDSDDGTVVVTDSRGSGASGKVVKVRIPVGGSAGADADSLTLDGDGKATLTFQATSVFTGELPFTIYYENGEADPIDFTVRRGT